MRKFYVILTFLLIITLSLPVFAQNDIPVNFLVNGKSVRFSQEPVLRNSITYVDLQSLSSALSLTYKTYPGHDSAVVSSKSKSICFVPYDQFATVSDLTGNTDSEYHYRVLSAPCAYTNGRIMVAARDIAEVFGYPLSYKAETNTVYFGYSADMISSSTKEAAYEKAYYFQNQAEFNLPSFGSGYCWATSYAMLMTNITGLRITPSDVAAINLRKSTNGAYCYHSDIVSEYNLKFVSALSEDSPYYGGRDSVSGGTLINNPTKDRAVTIAALKEALTLHPEGIMVRYAAYPHTMVAVAYEGDVILFNDPAPSGSSTYSDKGRYQCIPFEESCVPAKGIALEDVTFIQALSYK